MYTKGQIHITSFPSKSYIVGGMKIRNTKLILMTLSGISQKFENNPLYGIPTLHKDLQQESQTEYLQQLPLPHVMSWMSKINVKSFKSSLAPLSSKFMIQGAWYVLLRYLSIADKLHAHSLCDSIHIRINRYK